MSNDFLPDVIELISKDLEVETNGSMSEDEFIVMIAERVAYLEKHDKDLLLSYLYRLDIDQNKINRVLRVSNIIPPHESLAILIYRRQVERVRTKKSIKVEPIEGWEF